MGARAFDADATAGGASQRASGILLAGSPLASARGLSHAGGTLGRCAGEVPMPPRGVKSAKRKRQYEHIKESAEARGTSTKRAKEIAARTVNKQRAESGQAKSAAKSGGSTGKGSGRRASGGAKKASKKR
jgi:hypothetical protein